VLSDEDFVKSLDEVWAHSLEAADQSHRALAQRLREVEQERDKARYDRDVAHDCLLKAFDLLAQLEARVAELEG
jgi:MoxR-like ATPase